MAIVENVSSLINLIVYKAIVRETVSSDTFLEGIIMEIHFKDVIDFKMTRRGSLSNYQIYITTV